MGESFYNPFIPAMLEDLVSRGLVKDDKGAKCIFVPKRKMPLMVQKSDGGYNYDTTDLAALRYRVNELKASWVIAITDEGQKLHFDTLFDAAKLVGYYNPEKARVDHIGFGLVLQVQKDDGAAQEDDKTATIEEEKKEEGKKEEGKKSGKQAKVENKPKVGKMKTRDGETVKLMDLLNQARDRALEVFKERMKEGEESKVQVNEEELLKTAEILGISSIKYYDLKQARIQNYVFSFDKMLDPRGNTGVYLQYMYVRTLSILRKANVSSI